MSVRQWLWHWSSRAPLLAWGLSLALPVLYGGWVLASASSANIETLQQQIGEATVSVVDLRGQLAALPGRQTEANLGEGASKDLLELLLLHRCGLRQGIELSHQGDKKKLVLRGDSLEALCALRVVQQQPGGVRQLSRKADGTVNLTWEGT